MFAKNLSMRPSILHQTTAAVFFFLIVLFWLPCEEHVRTDSKQAYAKKLDFHKYHDFQSMTGIYLQSNLNTMLQNFLSSSIISRLEDVGASAVWVAPLAGADAGADVSGCALAVGAARTRWFQCFDADVAASGGVVLAAADGAPGVGDAVWRLA